MLAEPLAQFVRVAATVEEEARVGGLHRSAERMHSVKTTLYLILDTRDFTMACQICHDLSREREIAESNQRDAESAFAAATNEDEQGAALIALAKARREALGVRQRIDEHHKRGC